MEHKKNSSQVKTKFRGIVEGAGRPVIRPIRKGRQEAIREFGRGVDEPGVGGELVKISESSLDVSVESVCRKRKWRSEEAWDIDFKYQ